jgi:hypothetical protein
MNLDDALRSQLIDLAHALAIERGWSWREPVEITASNHEGEPAWVIRTNALARGCNIWVVARKADHKILASAYSKR